MRRSKELAIMKQDETYLAIPMFFLTGVRIGELLALGYEDFDQKKSMIRIHRSLCTDFQPTDEGWGQRQYVVEEHLKKNADSRNVLVPPEVFELVKKVKKIQMRKGGLLPLLFPVLTCSPRISPYMNSS